MEDVLKVGRTNVDTARRRNAENGFQKGRRVWTQYSHALEIVLLQEVCQASGAVCRLLVRAAENLLVCGDMVDCLGLYSW